MTVPSAHSFGEELRRERLVRDISLEEISSATKISVRLLKALEASDLSHLPSPAFTRGFIRAYARHVGIDPEEKVNAYLADLTSASSPVDPPKGAIPRSRFWRGRRATVGTIVGTVVTVLLVLGAIASPARRERPARRVAVARPAAPIAFKNVAVSNEPTPVLQDPAEEASVPRKTLALEFEDDSWAKIEADGETVLVGLIHRGDVRRFEAREGFRLTLGNAGAVRVSLDGRPLERLGGTGEVIRDVPVPRAPARG
jgi:cytoskeletal protein RodZ